MCDCWVWSPLSRWRRRERQSGRGREREIQRNRERVKRRERQTEREGRKKMSIYSLCSCKYEKEICASELKIDQGRVYWRPGTSAPFTTNNNNFPRIRNETFWMEFFFRKNKSIGFNSTETLKLCSELFKENVFNILARRTVEQMNQDFTRKTNKRQINRIFFFILYQASQRSSLFVSVSDFARIWLHLKGERSISGVCVRRNTPAIYSTSPGNLQREESSTVDRVSRSLYESLTRGWGAVALLAAGFC